MVVPRFGPERLIVSNVTTARDDRKQANEKERPHEQDEVLVVSLTDAGANPRTMVVQAFDAAAASSAVHCPRRSIDVAATAVLDLGQPTVDNVEIFLTLRLGNKV